MPCLWKSVDVCCSRNEFSVGLVFCVSVVPSKCLSFFLNNFCRDWGISVEGCVVVVVVGVVAGSTGSTGVTGTAGVVAGTGVAGAIYDGVL